VVDHAIPIRLVARTIALRLAPNLTFEFTLSNPDNV
jgi:hypothetical protein